MNLDVSTVIQAAMFVFNIVSGIALFLGGVFVKAIINRLDRLENAERGLSDSIGKLREEIPTNYVRREAFKDSLDNIFTMLRRIDEKLDTKADKEWS